jgi:hypothetical protein
LEKFSHFRSNSKTKHLNIKLKLIRDLKDKEEIAVKLIPSEDMVADTLNKASSSESLERLKARCFLVQFSPDCRGVLNCCEVSVKINEQVETSGGKPNHET